MGQLTRGEILTEGLLAAGNDSLRTRAANWLNQWLRKQYTAWPWPFLQRRASNLTLPSGTVSLAVGGGVGGVMDRIHKLLDPVFVYTPDRKTRATVHIRSLTGGSIAFDEDANDMNALRGVPGLLKVRNSGTDGQWTLVFFPAPSEAMLFSFDYLLLPDAIDPTVTGDSQVPLYPSDETMVQLVRARALQYMMRPEGDAQFAVVATMAVNDRMNFGDVDGTNDETPLDPAFFRTRGGRR